MRKLIFSALFTTIVSWCLSTPVSAVNLEYVAVNPCRLVDTRIAGGAILANTFRNFRVSGTAGELAFQGGTSNCLDPKAGTGLQPAAIVAYVIAVPAGASTGGVLTAYPSDLPPPPAGAGSTVNFAAGQLIGNTTTITLCNPFSCPADGEFAVLARNTNQHVVVDVQGYYYPAEANVGTAIYVSTYGPNLSSSSVSQVGMVTCPAGTAITGGGVDCTSDNFNLATTNFGVINASAPAGNSYLGYCSADALTYLSYLYGPPVRVYAVCMLPGGAATASVQAASEGSVTIASQRQVPQGEPSEEALLLLESMRNELEQRARPID